MKYIIASAIVAMFAITPASAMQIKCNAAGMAKVDAMIKEMKGKPGMGKMVKEAMAKTEMAAAKKQAGDIKGCSNQLTKAEMALHAK